MAWAQDYVSVAERIAEFYERYPDGSIQTEIVTHTDALVVMHARVYRSPVDPIPAMGHSQLGIPGKTPYTRDSELENCETSAVGRALAMLGFAAKDHLASREEIENKRPPTQATPPAGEGGGVSTATNPSPAKKAQVHPEVVKVGAWMKEADIPADDEAVMAVLGEKASVAALTMWVALPGHTAAGFIDAVSKLRESYKEAAV